MKKIATLGLATAMLFTLAAAETIVMPTPTPTPVKPDTMEYVDAIFDGQFNALFSENPDDRMAADLTAAMVLGTAPNGEIILDGAQGLPITYKGQESIYYGLGSVEIAEADGAVEYRLSIREDACFSDGHRVDIDDVIFTIYAACDPSYDGPMLLRYMPIEGMEAYTGSSAPISEMLINAGRDNTDFSRWDEATQTAFWSDLDAAGAALAQEVVDYILANYLSDNYTAEIGKTAAEVEADAQLQLQLGMTMWGYGHAYFEGATTADYWQAMLEEYDGDVLLAAETESAGSDLFSFIEGYEEKYGHIIGAAEAAEAISGVIRTGDFSLTLRATEENESILYALADLPVMPLHYYGSEELYDYAGNRFGFERQNLAALRENDDVPMGCGEYVFESFADGVVTLRGNENYFAGEAEYKTILISEK